MPPDRSYDLSRDEGKQEFADAYMVALRAKHIDVIAIADHNTGDWIDLMVAAGKRHGVVVFPGCEVTTGTGSDGIHLLIIGGLNKTSQDFDRLLAGPLGFEDPEFPRFRGQGKTRIPGSSKKTLGQILDDLPDDYLVVAPHAFTENGIASARTVNGDIRWRAIHHPRLVAVDPGDCTNPDGAGFKDRFQRRELTDFPRVMDLAFVATSDAYDLDSLGKRFSWIRMEAPSLEGLRQAFLDREARILCDWDTRLSEFADRNPNAVRHSWIKEVRLRGILSNSTADLTVPFHPGLNVIIGGRGSGKSTVVTAIRQMYAGYSTLPSGVRDESESFANTAFDGAFLSATHVLATSQERQEVSWTSANGIESRSKMSAEVSTNFRVRVVSQKELFARVSHDPRDPQAASRSLLMFVDESLGLSDGDSKLPGGWQRTLQDLSGRWSEASKSHQRLKADLAQLPAVRASVAELRAQVEAFDSEGSRIRRERIERRSLQKQVVDSTAGRINSHLSSLQAVASQFTNDLDRLEDSSDALFASVVESSRALIRSLRDSVVEVSREGKNRVSNWQSATEMSAWANDASEAALDETRLVEELQLLGLDPKAYKETRAQLVQREALERALSSREDELQVSADAVNSAWSELMAHFELRRTQRTSLLLDVSGRSERLRFDVASYRDINGWTSAVRDLLNLRIDGFLEDVPQLARWIWHAVDNVTMEARWKMWRDALASGDFGRLALRENAGLRQPWLKRLETLDEALRLRLATEVPDDALEMQFLRDNGDPQRSSDWQSIAQGSPGQRTAAMLAFVLHHGAEPLVLDQPEDDLDTEWLTRLVVKELRASRWKRQLIVVTHNANIPVNGDAERVIVLENRDGVLRIRGSASTSADAPDHQHVGPIENAAVREDIQNIMEGGVRAFILREQKYNNEVAAARWAS